MADRNQLDRPAFYRIKVRGSLPAAWAAWFNGLCLEHGGQQQPQVVTLSGYLPDQAALQGILNKLVNLNLQLLVVELLEPEGDE
jgi:hypothetical protein